MKYLLTALLATILLLTACNAEKIDGKVVEVNGTKYTVSGEIQPDATVVATLTVSPDPLVTNTTTNGQETAIVVAEPTAEEIEPMVILDKMDINVQETTTDFILSFTFYSNGQPVTFTNSKYSLVLSIDARDSTNKQIFPMPDFMKYEIFTTGLKDSSGTVTLNKAEWKLTDVSKIFATYIIKCKDPFFNILKDNYLIYEK